MFGGYDVIVSHNTVAMMKGASGNAFDVAYLRYANWQVTNNLLFMNNTNTWQGMVYNSAITPQAPGALGGLTAKLLLDAGAGTSSPLMRNYLFAGNAVLCGWLVSDPPLTEMAQSGLQRRADGVWDPHDRRLLAVGIDAAVNYRVGTFMRVPERFGFPPR
jgi:hypothetical protein